MAIIYVDSAAAGANNGTSWANAYTSIASTTGAAAGDFIYVDDGHVQDFAANTTLNWSNGTLANPVKIVCVDKTDDSQSSGARVGANSIGNVLTLTGNFRSAGMQWEGNVLQMGGGTQLYARSGTLKLINTGAGSQDFRIGTNNVNGRIKFEDTTIDFSGGNANSKFASSRDVAFFEFVDCTWAFHASQVAIFGKLGATSGKITITGSDLSAAPNALATWDSQLDLEITCDKCNVPSGWISSGPMTGTKANFNATTVLQNCANGTVSISPLGANRIERYHGVVMASLTRYRTGGADDGEQANSYSLEMTTNANALELYNPLEINLGSRLVASAASPSGATAKGIYTSYRCEPLATPAALTADAVSTWTGTGVGTKQKIDHTLSNGDTLTVYVASGVTLENDEFWIEVSEPDQVAGLVTVKAFLAKPSTTVYVDPKIGVA